MKLKGLFLILFLFLMPGCVPQADLDQNDPREGASPQELVISAAASLQEVLTAVGKEYRREEPGEEPVFNFGSSGTLQRQIEQGAPVDVFISAGVRQMDQLEEQGLLLPGTREDLLKNQLVLITGRNNEGLAGTADLVKDSVHLIVLGIPETVPAGQYTREALLKLDLWDTLQPNLVMAKDVKQVLTYVETGNADAGFVYYSDALGSERVKIVEVLAPELHEAILYPAAVVKETKNKAAAQAFMEYLKGDTARRIFEEYGFMTIQRGN
ncbi:MAG: molybdate ABC transporter substrate-binding protein [Clostridia bacterium]|nr:molybdate ABC transporter substrate-binding protein [Clostridia bacterium]